MSIPFSQYFVNKLLITPLSRTSTEYNACDEFLHSQYSFRFNSCFRAGGYRVGIFHPLERNLQPLGSGLRISSDDLDSVGEFCLEDDFWQLRPNFHKKRLLRSVIVFKSGVLFRHVSHPQLNFVGRVLSEKQPTSCTPRRVSFRYNAPMRMVLWEVFSYSQNTSSF